MANNKPKRTQKAGPAVDSGDSSIEASYFLSLTVRNVRCFGDEPQTLDLSNGDGTPAQWTILLGNNGTGKTTLLQLLAGFDKVLVDVRESSDDPPKIVERPVLRSFEWYTLNLNQGNFSRDRCSAPADAKVVVAHGPDDLRKRGAFNKTYFHAAIREFALEYAWNAPRCFGYGAARRMGKGSLSVHLDDDATRSLFSDQVTLRNAEEWLLQLDYAASKTSAVALEERNRLAAVKELLIELLPEVADIRFQQPTKKQRTPQVEFQTPYGWVPLSAIGYGYQTLMAWIVDLASRMFDCYADSDNPLAEPAVALIDEIDLHLHPSWQQKVMQYVSKRFPSTQFIATAHSPLIVQAAPGVNANVAVLRRDGDRVLIDNDIDSVRGWRVDQILASDLYNVSPRAPEVQAFMDQRRQLLSKPKLSGRDRKTLAQLDKELGNLPVGESSDDMKSMQLLAKSLELMRRKQEQ